MLSRNPHTAPGRALSILAVLLRYQVVALDEVD